MFSVTKDPDADLDYQLDWSSWLGSDTIVNSAWSVPAGSGLTTHDESVDESGRITTVWLSGGTASNKPYVITNHITTAGGRQEDRSLLVRVIER